MICIGVISGKKFFNNVKKEIYLKNVEKDIEIIELDINNMENLEKKKCNVIILEEILNNKTDNEIGEVIEKLTKYAKFILLNIDNNRYKLKYPNVVTYGLNPRADITVSSITENNMLIYWQKNIRITEEEMTEIEEIKVLRKNSYILNIYEILSVFNVFSIGKCIKIAEI